MYDNTHESILSQVSTIYNDKEIAKKIASMVTLASTYNKDKNGNTGKVMELRSICE